MTGRADYRPPIACLCCGSHGHYAHECPEASDSDDGLGMSARRHNRAQSMKMSSRGRGPARGRRGNEWGGRGAHYIPRRITHDDELGWDWRSPRGGGRTRGYGNRARGGYRRYNERGQSHGRHDFQNDRGDRFRVNSREYREMRSFDTGNDFSESDAHDESMPYRQAKKWRARGQKTEQRRPRTRAVKGRSRFDDNCDDHKTPDGRNTCRECGEEGHWARDCPVRKKELMRKHGDVCNRCGKAGHWARDCVSKGGWSKMAYLKSLHGEICNRCGKHGHWARDCKESYNGPGYEDY